MKNCLICHKQFNERKATAKYCSRSCLHDSQKKYWITLKCLICGNEFLDRNSPSRIGRTKYCSIECRRKAVGALMIGNKYAEGTIHTEEWKKENAERHKGNKYGVGKRYWLNKKRPNISGENNYNWKGGINLERYCTEMKKWVQSIFYRDDYTCQDCGARCGNGKSVKLHAHHIKSFADYPNLRFDVGNGKTLCVLCHYQNYHSKNGSLRKIAMEGKA